MRSILGTIRREPRKPEREPATGWAAWKSRWQAAFALACGLLSALLLNVAMPGLEEWRGHWQLLPLCLVPLFLTTRLKTFWAVFAGLCFGLAAWFGQLSWIFIVLSQYGGLPPWQAWPTLCLLVFYMALYPALACGLLSALMKNAKRPRHAALVALFAPAILWTGLDALRSVLFTGFPWMDLGYGLFRVPFLLVPADLGGHHLLTFAILLISALIIFLPKPLYRSSRAFWRAVAPPLAASILILATLFGYTALRTAETEEEIAVAQRAKIGYVQGNISQDLKWTPTMRQETVARYLGLSKGLAANGDMDMLVWPETALPFYPQDEPLAGQVSAFVARSPRSPALLTGAPLYRIEEHAEGKTIRYYNGALLLERDEAGQSRVAGLYSKQHLVPFGEYIPLKRLLFFLKPLAETIGDFSPGLHSGPIDAGKLRPGVFICYESIFPNVAHKSVAQGANLLVNLTNDAWYGLSAAPVQSLAMTTLRAVENRRSLVRAANTGISGFIDPLGRISGESALFTEAAAAESLPILRSQTVFTRIGHIFGFFCAALILPLLAPLLLKR